MKIRICAKCHKSIKRPQKWKTYLNNKMIVVLEHENCETFIEYPKCYK